MSDHEHRYCQRLSEAAALAASLEHRTATPEELSKAAALLASRPSARQPELDLSKKA